MNLPHDWSIEGEFSEKHPAGTGGGALPGGVGWYRKTFSIPATAKGKLIFVEFDGVYRNSEVWINGHYLGKRPYGYSTFEYELTPHLVYGAKPNVIAVKVDNSQQPNSRWYSGSGIYRNVWLTTLDPVHIGHWGTYVTTPEVNSESATIVFRSHVNNGSKSSAPVNLTTIIQDANGREVTRHTQKGVAAKADEVELFLNDRSQGAKRKQGDDMHVFWRLAFETGVLKAVSRMNGQVVLTREVRTAEAPAKIVLIPDRRTIKADGTDLSFVTVKVVDQSGTLVPAADNLIKFEVTGSGSIAGVDNGNQISHESFKANQRKAFHGMALAIIQSKQKPGRIVLKASSNALASASVVINAR